MTRPFDIFFGIDGPALIFLGIVMAAAAYTDFTRQKIPNILTFSTFFAGLGYHGLVHGMTGVFFSLAGAGTGLGLLIIFYMLSVMGAGDVKLMAAAGAILGAKGIFITFLITAIYGGIYSLVMILTHRDIFKGFFRELFNTLLTFLLIKKYYPVTVSEDRKRPKLCYGIAIALGTFTYMGLKISGYEFSLNN
ncbi:MAG TPA: A24 family peptidase [Desulfotignum sp.]|nr:A24 family peptidase [Desulfotignum sp.]